MIYEGNQCWNAPKSKIFKSRSFHENCNLNCVTHVHWPITSLGHQAGRRVFWERPKFFKLCSIVLNYVQHIFPWGRKFFQEGEATLAQPLVTDLHVHKLTHKLDATSTYVSGVNWNVKRWHYRKKERTILICYILTLEIN